MSGDGTGEKGHPEARTREDPGAGAWPSGDELAASVQALAGAIGEEGEQLDLIAGSPDLDDFDTLAAAANKVASQRRARGRPAGSRNRRNSEVFDYLAQLGHRDPLVTLSMVSTADPLELAKALGTPAVRPDGGLYVDSKGDPIINPADPVKVLSIITKAAADLAKFGYAQPKELNVNVRKLHLMLAGDLGGAVGGNDGTLSIFGDEKANEINGDAVRQQDG